MASLTGNQIKDTYEGLLKTTDNDVLGSSAKVITDGAGNASGLSLDTNGNVAVAADLSVGDELIVTGAASVGGTLTLDGALIDSNGSSGTGGQVLASTVTGTDWVSLSEISGVDGTGTADKIAKWSDADTIANSTITDDGALVSFATPISVTGAVNSTGANTASSFVKTGGVSTEFLKADGSVDGTVYATEADLTTAEGRISVNEGDIVAIEAKTDFITVTQAVNLDTMESDIAGVKTKTDFITVTQAVDLDDMESDIATNTSDIATNASAITTKVSKSGDTMTGNLTATGFIKTGGTSSQFLKADGSVDSSTYLTAESDTLDSVTDRGASTTNSIAVGNVTATSFIKSGGTSAQFLKADGSIDSNAYITAESDTLDSVTDRGAVTTNTVTVGDLNALASSLNSLSVVTTSSFTGDASFDVDTLFVDVSADRVGVNTNVPTEALDVVGNVKASGSITGGSLVGNLTGNVSGNVTGNVTGNLTGSVLTAAQTNITSVGTLSSLAVSGAATLSSTLAVTGTSAFTGNIGVGFAPQANIKTFIYDNSANFALAVQQDGSGIPFQVTSGGVIRMSIANGGDISFRDSSANEAFYWDASAASLGIGGVPSQKLEVVGNVLVKNSLGNAITFTAAEANNSGTFYMYNNGSLANVISTNGDSYFNGGNVGIGAIPISTLDVENTSGATLTIGTAAAAGSQGSKKFTTINFNGFANNPTAQIQSWDEAASTGQGYLTFSTQTGSGLSEKMRILPSGNLLVSTTNTDPSGSGVDGARIGGGILSIATTSAYAGDFGRNGTDGEVVRFRKAGSTVGSISVTGSATAYNTSSDYRLKEDWVAMEGALDRVDALNPINFAWKSSGERVDGFLAHELAEVVPEAVTGEKDAVELKQVEVSPPVLDEEGNVITEAVYEEQEVPVYQGIDQSKIVPLLAAGLQEAHALIKELRAELNALKQA